MSRPPHERDEKLAEKIKTLAGFGIPEVSIGKVLGISAPTMRKYYQAELELGHIHANSEVAQSLFQMATNKKKPNVAAAIFWCKARLGWRDRDPNQNPAYVSKREAAEALARAAEGGAEWEKLLHK